MLIRGIFSLARTLDIDIDCIVEVLRRKFPENLWVARVTILGSHSRTSNHQVDGVHTVGQFLFLGLQFHLEVSRFVCRARKPVRYLAGT